MERAGRVCKHKKVACGIAASLLVVIRDVNYVWLAGLVWPSRRIIGDEGENRLPQNVQFYLLLLFKDHKGAVLD